MAMNDLELMRLYLRDQDEDNARFSEEDLQQLYEGEGESVEGGVALGWLLVAAEMGEDPVSASVGNTSESYGQPTERYKVAMAMHHYWKSKVPAKSSSNGLWWELVPDHTTGGIVGELIQHQEFLLEYYTAA